MIKSKNDLFSQLIAESSEIIINHPGSNNSGLVLALITKVAIEESNEFLLLEELDNLIYRAEKGIKEEKEKLSPVLRLLKHYYHGSEILSEKEVIDEQIEQLIHSF